MTTRPISATKDFGKPQVFVAPVEKADLSSLEDKIAQLTNQVEELHRQAAHNSKGVRLLLELHNRHWRLFDAAGIYSIAYLARMDAATRRSVYAKLKKSDAFDKDAEKQLTKKEFDEICSVANAVLEE